MKKKSGYLFIVLFALQIAAQAQLTYKDVAPVFIQRCSSCHHQGKVFPYFTNYSSTSQYKGLISHDLQIGRMPLWLPDTSYTRFAHEQVITQTEKTKILDWITSGALAGDTSQAEAPPRYSNMQLNGTPDLILNIPNYVSTAGATDKNVCFSLPMGLTQNRILRAYEVVSGKAHLAHHIMINVDTLGTSTTDFSGSCAGSSVGFILGGWAPGSPAVVFPGVDPVRFGITVKSGSKLVLQVHYPAGTAGLTDSTQIRLFFYPLNTTGIRNLTAVPIKNSSFSIPPDTITSVIAKYPRNGVLPADISIYSIFPHSHKICTSIRNYASNGTTTIPLCRINKWNFERQGFYTFRSLLKIPAGYNLYGKHIFDNTTANPNYSPLTVNAGPGSDDEMVFDGVMWTVYQPGDENIDIKSIIENDSLFRLPAIPVSLPQETTVMAYPNPFNDKLTIAYELVSGETISLSVYNSIGQKIIDVSKTESEGLHYYEWDGNIQGGGFAAPGIYTYILKTGTARHCGKIMLSPKD
ncbi:MAG: T9SS type A sorting domain-containing protein [Bacteroidota bacterium]